MNMCTTVYEAKLTKFSFEFFTFLMIVVHSLSLQSSSLHKSTAVRQPHKINPCQCDTYSHLILGWVNLLKQTIEKKPVLTATTNWIQTDSICALAVFMHICSYTYHECCCGPNWFGLNPLRNWILKVC